MVVDRPGDEIRRYRDDENGLDGCKVLRDAELTLRPKPLELLIYIGQDVRAYPLPPEGRVTIGRDPSNDIRIEHRSVSRQHLTLHLGEAVLVEDRFSSNGTFLLGSGDDTSSDDGTVPPGSKRGRKVSPGDRCELCFGDVLRAGSVMFVVQPRNQPAEFDGKPSTGEKLRGPAVLLDEEMHRLYDLATRAATTDISVLVLGETGSGKEILAETIHYRSRRAARPFLRLNCAALSESLLESELFGYERGAFTGASQTRVGLLESSNGGTVFLDEIGELPISVQVKLLRVLEDRGVRRVGANKSRPVDVRFVTATNRDLKREVAEGRFREDLFFRINGVMLNVPPLRQRQAEIEPLARHFLRAFCRKSGIVEPQLTAEALEQLHRYSWPGNVRELRNAMERAPFLCAGRWIGAEHIPQDCAKHDSGLFQVGEDALENTAVFVPPDGFSPRPGESERHAPGLASRPGAPERDQRQQILDALDACGGNQTRAARLLGVSRRTLINRLDEYGLPRPRKG